MKNLIRGHMYQLKKDHLFFRMSCSRSYFSDCNHPDFVSGSCIRPYDGYRQYD